MVIKVPAEVRDSWAEDENVSPEEVDKICEEVEAELNIKEVKQND
jgi:hypothetical protein